MKKLIAIIGVLVLTLACASAGAEATYDAHEYVLATGYDLLYVTDIFSNDDAEMDENGDFLGGDNNGVFVQGCFGTVDMSQGEANAVDIGFDSDQVFTMSLAEGCVVLMPKDWSNPVENVVIDDPQSWCEAFMEASADGSPDAVYPRDFYALFELNDNSDLIRLEYCYMP